MWASWSWTQLTIYFGSRLTPNGKKQKQNHWMGSDDTTQCTVNSELGKETWGRGRIKRVEAEGEGKGHSFSQPQLCCCCKNIKVLLHCASQQDSPASAFDGCVSRPQHNALIFGESQWIQRGCRRLIKLYVQLGAKWLLLVLLLCLCTTVEDFKLNNWDLIEIQGV